MGCPNCGGESYLTTYRARYPRAGKSLLVKSKCMMCSSCRTRIGPFKFLTPALANENDANAEIEWERKYNEKMPPEYPMGRIRKIMRTEEGKRRVAEAFGKALYKEVEKTSKESKDD
jgi:hypothetical protein